MFNQIALDRDLPKGEECRTAVDINGVVTCRTQDIKALVESGGGVKPVMYEVDHHFPGGESAKVGIFLPYIITT